ncbi:hypothetical protein [Streptomyces sp. NPDC046985]|uniref:hypothetical protein n=1 Tax=Streptomyces sp. NPDC046985 TaxID=3155377 RepID=UPI0033DF493D
MSKKTNSRCLAVLLATTVGSLALTVLPVEANAASGAVTTPAEYVSWLQSQEVTDPGAATVLQQYQALPGAQQAQFLNYINDPSFMSGLTAGTADTPEEDPGGKNSGKPITFVVQSQGDVQGGGDVQVVAGGGVDTSGGGNSPSSLGRSGDWTASYWVNDTVFGVKVTQVKLSEHYHSTSTRADKVYDCLASHYNYVPFSSFSHGAVQNWISAAGNAHCETAWTGHIDAGPSWSATEHMWADETGFRHGSLS